MFPRLLDNPAVPTYGVLVLLALVVGWVMARHHAVRDGVDVMYIDWMAPLVLFAGLVGAWVAGWLTDTLVGVSSGGGRVLLGALLASVAAGIGWCVWNGLKLGVIGDVFAPAIAAGVAIGRIGCFFAGCCWGTRCDAESPIGVVYPAGSFAYQRHHADGLIDAMATASMRVHPVQLYEAVAMSALAVVLWRWGGKRVVPGEVFLAMAIGYALTRFMFEFLRGDNPVILADLTFSQVVCVALLPFCVLLWILRRRLYGRCIIFESQDVQ